jgi:crotonobetainyl-CoA:carnitine CoA-transferase CaiB-like acyl-CoA transferase
VRFGDRPDVGRRALDLRVVDHSRSLGGAYCGKLLADAGAAVDLVDPAHDHPLRGAGAGPGEAALFQYLSGSKRVVDDAGDLGTADLLIESGQLEDSFLEDARRRHPRLVVVSITPFGRSGPWAGREAPEFILQGWCGSLGTRGYGDRPPLQAGGRIGEWSAGAFAAVGALAAVRGAASSRCGEHVDVSELEAMCLTFQTQLLVEDQIGEPFHGTSRSVNVPSIVRTSDGHVGLFIGTPTQAREFMTMIGRPDLRDTEWLHPRVRYERRDEFMVIVESWSCGLTADEVMAAADCYRIAAAPICDSEMLLSIEHFAERGVFVDNAGGFVEPRPPYRIDLARPPADNPFGGAVSEAPQRPHTPPSGQAAGQLPLAGLRVVDLTMFWAGPAATQLLGLLGADVVKIESAQRPDGARTFTLAPGAPDWWERSALFQICNANKRDVTLDLSDPAGRAVLLDLIRDADVVVENFTPRVLGKLGLQTDQLLDANPRLVVVRMPGFGLSGPWRDRTAYGPTIEEVVGLAWSTGYGPEQPEVPRGVSDPLAGVHAAYATLVALAARDRWSGGLVVEAPMVEAALAIAAEDLVEYQSTGFVRRPDGNRSRDAAPQGIYPCAGDDRWIAVSVGSDQEWHALVEVTGDPELAADGLADVAGRHRRHDGIDARIAAWTATRDRDDAVALLLSAGVPAAPVVRGAQVRDNPQLRARGFFEQVDHSVLGQLTVPGPPFRFRSRTRGWISSAGPTLGEHNTDVLVGELGMSPDQYARLADDQIIGTIALQGL